jgi:hypothetical protein
MRNKQQNKNKRRWNERGRKEDNSRRTLRRGALLATKSIHLHADAN